MGLFDNVKRATNAQEVQDRVGGGFQPIKSGVYKAAIKQMYAKPSKSGAIGVTIEYEIRPQQGNPRKFTETYYVTNKNGENFYIDKDGQQQYLPGFSHVNDMCLGLTGKTMFELNDEGKLELKNIKVYNFTTKKDEIEQLPTFVPLLDKELALAILERHENKTKQVNGAYVPVNEKRIVNVVEKVLLLKDGVPFTHLEVKAGVNEPKFVTEWLEAWKDKVDDRYEEVAGGASTAAAPTTAMNLG